MTSLYVISLDVGQNATNLKTNSFHFLMCSVIPLNRFYKCIVSTGRTYLNDHSSNMIYLITCNKYKFQYVGKTSQNLSKRSNRHKPWFRNLIAYVYFSKDHRKNSSHTVSIIENFEGTEHTDKNTMEFATKPIFNVRERYWMHKLRAIFSYSINDRIGDEFNLIITCRCCWKIFIFAKIFPFFFHKTL